MTSKHKQSPFDYAHGKNTPLKRKVFVGMSGGVDSSVAAMLLKNQGYEVVGVYLKCYVQPDRSCLKEAMDAMEVAEKLEIPFHIWDFQKEYKQRVIDYMIKGYREGRTPNPDIECNREIKFGMFLEKALVWGADYVATGHYVRIAKGDSLDVRRRRLEVKNKASNILHPALNFSSLFEAHDKNKDQSYFLWTLTQAQLKHALFPIGDYLKSEVREMARKAGLKTADKKDSQGICFLGKVTLDDFLKEYLPEKRGAVLNLAGEKLGEHNGAHFYTIGQREGIGNIKHQKGVKIHKPLYVVSKDVRRNVVIVAEDGDENLTRKEVELTGVNFVDPSYDSLISAGGGQARLSDSSRNKGIVVWARVRYRQPLVEAKLCKSQIAPAEAGSLSEGNRKPQNFRLFFDKSQKFVAPGQSAVFYTTHGQLIGGGIIK